MLIHLERGNFGCDVQQAKARAVHVAGEATKRHSDLPTEFVLPDTVSSKWTWLPLTARLAAAFGWEKFDQKPDVAEQELAKCDQGRMKAQARKVTTISAPLVDIRRTCGTV